MAGIRSHGNERTEVRMAQIFRESGISGWRRHVRLPGRPDFVFRDERLAVFVDGCFWHCCPQHSEIPTSNRTYWLPKLLANQRRDRRVASQLRARGWKVIRVWEHELRASARVAARIRRALRTQHNEVKRSSVDTLTQFDRRRVVARRFRSVEKH